MKSELIRVSAGISDDVVEILEGRMLAVQDELLGRYLNELVENKLKVEFSYYKGQPQCSVFQNAEKKGKNSYVVGGLGYNAVSALVSVQYKIQSVMDWDFEGHAEKGKETNKSFG